MMRTLVIQSHRNPIPYNWLNYCLASVKSWAETNNFEYQFMHDQLFDVLPAEIVDKYLNRPVVLSDLARLLVCRNALSDKYERVVWLDSDFLVFAPDQFVLSDSAYAVGREVWIQKNDSGKLKAYKKVHNAFLMFRRGNAFLDFYIETAQRMLMDNSGGVPAQFIGPKLLTALHNVAVLPVLETAGMLSPLVVQDIDEGQGSALGLFNRESSVPIAAANLCISSYERDEITNQQMASVINKLLNEGMPV